MLHIASSLQENLRGARTRPRFAFHYACAPFEHARALLLITSGPHSNMLTTCFRSRLFAARTYPRSVFKHACALLYNRCTGVYTPQNDLASLQTTHSCISEQRTTHRETAPRHSKPFSTSRLTQQFGCVEIPKTTRCISTRLQTFGIGKLLGISLSRDRFSSTFAQINSSSRVPLLC